VTECMYSQIHYYYAIVMEIVITKHEWKLSKGNTMSLLFDGAKVCEYVQAKM